MEMCGEGDGWLYCGVSAVLLPWVSAGSNAGHTRYACVYMVNEVRTYWPTTRGGAAGLFLIRGEPAVLPPGTPVMQV